MKFNIQFFALPLQHDTIGVGMILRRIQIHHEVVKLIDPNQDFVNVNILAELKSASMK